MLASDGGLPKAGFGELILMITTKPIVDTARPASIPFSTRT